MKFKTTAARRAERKKKRHEKQYGERAVAIKAMRCCVPGCAHWPSDAAHVKSRAAGGTKRDLVPLCHEHHMEQHSTGIKTFQEKHGIDLALIAAEIDRRLSSKLGGVT